MKRRTARLVRRTTPSGYSLREPFPRPSPLPFGFPDFDAIREEHFAPAFARGMAEQRAEVDAIIAPTRAADLREHARRAGAVRRDCCGGSSAVFFNLRRLGTTPGIREIEAEVAPLLAAHADAIRLDPALFARHRRRCTTPAHELGLDAESLRLLER